MDVSPWHSLSAFENSSTDFNRCSHAQRNTPWARFQRAARFEALRKTGSGYYMLDNEFCATSPAQSSLHKTVLVA